MNNHAEFWSSLGSFLQVGLLLCVLLLLSGCSSTPVWVEGTPKHHTTNGFRNYPLIPTASSKGFSFYVRRIWVSFFLPKVPSGHYLSEKEAIAQLNELREKDTLTWLGQSAFLLRINGKVILTDPFLTEFASPFIRGPRRFVAPGITIKNLPPIDIMIISHDHYDHLDAETIEALHGKGTIQVFVPLGLKDFFTKRGYANVQELDWEESTSVDDIQITALPMVHDSGRGIGGKNKTLWCSWAILSPSGKYLFIGDTAYSPTIFRNIGAKHDFFDLAIVPIGGYEPRGLMWMSHAIPEEAVKIGMDTKAKVLVGGHWGTIELTDEPHWEPPQRFREAARLIEVSQEQIWIMKIGETRILPKTRVN